MSELQEAFREAARREFAHVPAEEDLHWVFSRRFERRMRRIIRAQEYGYWNLVNTTAKRVAIAAAIIVMLLSTVMAIKPIRERVIKFFVDVYEEYFEIRFGEEEKDDLDPTPKPMVRYTLTELPEGYEEVEFMELDHLLWTEWQNGNANIITLQQELGTHEVTFDHTDATPNVVMYNGKKITYQYSDNTNLFIWEEDGYIFHLMIHESYSIEKMLAIIASLEIQK